MVRAAVGAPIRREFSNSSPEQTRPQPSTAYCQRCNVRFAADRLNLVLVAQPDHSKIRGNCDLRVPEPTPVNGRQTGDMGRRQAVSPSDMLYVGLAPNV